MTASFKIHHPVDSMTLMGSTKQASKEHQPTASEPVSGQIDQYELSMDDETFPNKVLPAAYKGKYLCTGSEYGTSSTSGISPSEEGGKVVRVTLEHRKRVVARNGDIKMTTMNGDLYAGGATIRDYRRPINQGCFVLQNSNGTPIVLCLQDRHKLNARSYFIHGRYPMYPGDNHVAQEGRIKFYPWYRFVANPYLRRPDERATIQVWNGEQYNQQSPCLFANTASLASHPLVAGGGVATGLPLLEGGIVISSKNDGGGNNHGLIQLDSNRRNHISWNVTSGPGSDPALILCVAAILEECTSGSVA